jgi:hypothetical protein
MKVSDIYKYACIYAIAAKSKKEYMREYMRKRYHDKRKKLIEELGGKCVSCGITENLHIDHIDSKRKKENGGFRAADVHSISEARLEQHKDNLQLLCEKCHKEKTQSNWDRSAPKPKHGTYWNYRRHGCRCKKCTDAYKTKLKEWRDKAKAKAQKTTVL